MHRIKSLGKLPKRKITIDNLLAKDDTITAINNFLEERDNIEDLLIIFSKDDHIQWITNGLTISQQVYLCEVLKHALFEGE